MSLDRLIEGIGREAAAEAERILAQARQEAARLVEEAERRAAAEAAAWEQAEVERCRREAAQRVAQARLEARSLLLHVRHEQVDAVFTSALAALRAMDDDAYRAWMRRRVLEACTADDEAVVVAAHDRARLTPAWQAETEQALRARRGIESLRLCFDGEAVGGGFVLRHPRYEIDARFAALLHALGDEKRTEVAALLFRDAEDFTDVEAEPT